MIHQKQNRGFSAIEIIVAIAVVVLVGIMGYIGWKALTAPKQVDSNPPITQGDTAAAETINVPNRGLYTKKNASGTVYFYGIKGRTSDDITDDTSRYITVTLAEGALVYQTKRSESDPFVKSMIKTTNGKYIHIDQTTGLGGVCQDNNDSFTLLKRLTTASPNLVFDEYIEADTPAYALKLINYTIADGALRTMSEGQSETNTCKSSTYSSALKDTDLIITVSSSETSQLYGSLGWEDIKDDQNFINMIQSIRVTE